MSLVISDELFRRDQSQRSSPPSCNFDFWLPKVVIAGRQTARRRAYWRHLANTMNRPLRWLLCGLWQQYCSEEVGAHNSTSPWTTLAESSRENSVPVMCSCVPLPYWHSAIIPCRDPPLNCRCTFTSTSSECFYVDAGHTDHTTHHAGWSSLPGDCCSSVKRSSVVCSFCAIAAAVPPRPQDGTACFSHRTLHHSVQLSDRL